jgi:hypothetical protein
MERAPLAHGRRCGLNKLLRGAFGNGRRVRQDSNLAFHSLLLSL